MLLNGSSKRQNACAVSLQGKQRFMGDEASAIARSNFKNTSTNFKRLLGRKFNEPEVQAELERMPGVKFVELPEGTVGIQVMYNDEQKVLSMEQCMAMMLTKLASITEEATKAKPADIVVSVPGWYTDAQRVAMLNSCHIAQLFCMRLLHEGTAVALEYGMFKNAKGVFDAEKPTHVAFVDFGQSGFSVTIASFVTGKLYIKAACYDRALGGRDFDDVIGKKIAEAFAEKHKDDPWGNTKARMKLLVASEKCKKTLSPPGVSEAHVNCECLMNDIDFNYKMTLDDFKAGAEPLLARMMPVMQSAVEQSGIPPAEIATVEIVGGSTRLGFVKERVADILIGLGLPIDKSALNMGLSTTMNADEAVSRGTAWQAALMSPRFRVKEYQIFDAVTYPVKLDWEASSSGGDAAATADDAAEDGDKEGETPAASGSTSALLFKKNDATPSTKKVTFRRAGPFSITASYDPAALSDLPAGLDPTLRIFTVQAPVAEDPNSPPKIRVNVKHNYHGIVEVSSAQLMQEIKEDAKEEPAKATEPPPAPAGEEKKMDEGADGSKNGEGTPSASAEGPAPATEGKEGEAKDAGGAAVEEAPRKTRFRKVDLAVESSAVGMSEAALTAAHEDEAKMAHQDLVIEETNAAKNDVEAYIYSQRDVLIGDLRTFCQDSEKEKQEAALTAAEDWLYYGDGYDTQKSTYVEKLRDLKKLGEKMVYRQLEARDRDACVKGLKAAVEDYKKWLVSSATDEAFAHISDEEKATVRTSCDEAESWVYAQLEAQAKLAENVDPCFSCQDVNVKRKELVKVCKPIVNKPKPLPPKPEAEEKKPEENPAASDEASAKDDQAPPPAADGEAPPPVADGEPAMDTDDAAEVGTSGAGGDAKVDDPAGQSMETKDD